MQKHEWWQGAICVAVGVFGGFHSGGQRVVLDGQVVKGPAFSVGGAIAYFLLSVFAVVVLEAIVPAVKKRVIDEYEESRQAVVRDPSQARAVARGGVSQETRVDASEARETATQAELQDDSPQSREPLAAALAAPINATAQPAPWRPWEFRVGDLVRYGYKGPYLTVTLVDESGIHLVSQGGGRSHVAGAVAQDELLLVERAEEF
jgi:hypothetical protein